MVWLLEFVLFCGMLCIWWVLTLLVACSCLGLLVVALLVAFDLILLFDSVVLRLLGFFGGLLRCVGFVLIYS